MSIEAITKVFHHSKAKGTDLALLLAIAEHDGADGAWPSVQTLARMTHVTERAVQYALERLVQMGELRIEHNAGGGDWVREDRRTNRYLILATCPAVCDGTNKHRMPESRGEAGCTPMPESRGEAGFVNGVKPVSSRGEAGFVHGVKPVAPEPSLEPPVEPSEGNASANSRSHADIIAAGDDDPEALDAEIIEDEDDDWDAEFWASTTTTTTTVFVGLRHSRGASWRDLITEVKEAV